MSQSLGDNTRKSSELRRTSSSSTGSISGPRHLSMDKGKVKEKVGIENPDLVELEKNVAAKIGSLFLEKKEREMSSSHDEKDASRQDL